MDCPLCLLDFGMLCFHFNLVVRILCFPFWLYRGPFISVVWFLWVCVLSVVSTVVASSFVPLWSYKVHDVILLFLYLLNHVLDLNIWGSIFEESFIACWEKKCVFFSIWMECSIGICWWGFSLRFLIGLLSISFAALLQVTLQLDLGVEGPG